MNPDEDEPDLGIDWDRQLWEPLQELLTACDIDPDTAYGPSGRELLRQRVLHARAAMTATAVVTPALIAVAATGAPATATVPVSAWGLGWIGYGIWLSAGSPRAVVVLRGTGTVVSAVWRWLTRTEPAPSGPMVRPEPAVDLPPF
ncbi:hypothetical protein ACIRRA_13490 [Nocardia sp. NPDC101769]|uniref:hypothetical protein n=1 Tax=Nocardia sp. NPDC101769 TaxID=3364333 RepID=UPI003803395E